ncbi:NAD(P)-dependent dehydrogenase (short-subunit alcohol dehydrogenase family) [Pantoea agglomerans]|uniref:oxidoreductase n=1 Tax=Enterobacter agglomerans TaxID=549 RepID=UPI0015F916CF|nr:oxidoreductase [Pantoea agglomerans]MBA8867109.1 NAD(P)-dependent dehydrogenase (short-subunit alcohol dehydrogenase family) [Pantoea agglomerans]MBA8894133.1 NAD(P)-dependent dehydrogenase (short-subunit alcohol dehydrogenase family) [Pantoea agglomerans]
MKNNNPVALVTGVSSGIGLAVAEKLTDAGYRVYGTSRRPAEAGRFRFRMLTLDVTSDASVDAAVSELIAREGRIDLLVSNAGFGLEPAAAEESSMAQAQALFDTNFMGVVRMNRAVLPQMRAQGSGRIINIGSVLGLVPMLYVALYAASKHAVEGYTEALDHEVRTVGIHASVIEPAYTRTQFEANNVVPDAPRDENKALRQKLKQVVSDAMKMADEPGVVAQVVVSAAQDSRPRLRYTAGKTAAKLAFMRRFMPVSLLDAGIRKSLGI